MKGNIKILDERVITLDSDILYRNIEDTIKDILVEVYKAIGMENGDISQEQERTFKENIDNIYELFLELAEANKPQGARLEWLTWEK